MNGTIEDSDMLKAFDTYARQFTYKNHPAEPRNFPCGYRWFEAGYAAAKAEATPVQPVERPASTCGLTECAGRLMCDKCATKAAAPAQQPILGLQNVHDAITADPSLCDIDPIEQSEGEKK